MRQRLPCASCRSDWNPGQVAGQPVVIAAPAGFCIDPASRNVSAAGGFVLVGDCARAGEWTAAAGGRPAGTSGAGRLGRRVLPPNLAGNRVDAPVVMNDRTGARFLGSWH